MSDHMVTGSPLNVGRWNLQGIPSLRSLSKVFLVCLMVSGASTVVTECWTSNSTPLSSASSTRASESLPPL